MDKRKVYISSTFKDLKEFRAALIEEFNKALSHQYELTRIMEHMYNTGDKMPLSEQCIEEVKKSDIYILIVGDSIGSFPPDSNRSYTQLEYDEAMKEDNKTVIRFVKEPSISNTEDEKLIKFIKEFNNKSIDNFKDIRDLQISFYRIFIELKNKTIFNREMMFKLVITSVILIIGGLSTSFTYDNSNDIRIRIIIPLLFLFPILFLFKDKFLNYKV